MTNRLCVLLMVMLCGCRTGRAPDAYHGTAPFPVRSLENEPVPKWFNAIALVESAYGAAVFRIPEFSKHKVLEAMVWIPREDRRNAIVLFVCPDLVVFCATVGRDYRTLTVRKTRAVL